MNVIVEQFQTLWSQAFTIWVSGGWAMYAIAFNALVMFGIGVNVYVKLRGKGFLNVPERKWRKWIHHPEQRRGPVGEILDFITGARTIKDANTSFEELQVTEIAPFDRDLRVMRICVAAAPLLGLLGTVTGMLSTFDALAKGGGGDKTMGMVAAGISEALITTETGLMIALPGLFLQYILGRNCERYKSFLAHLETVYMQILHKRLRKQGTTA
jgi:biopolymer transport protein ExbB